MRKPLMVEFTGTPEAGKTTAVRSVANKLLNLGYNVSILKESAENLPEEIPKGTWDANLWMHYQTQSGLIKASYFNSDIILIDRGLIDSMFYGKKFLWEGKCTKKEYEKFENQFIERLFPNFLIALTVPPDISVKRRGGEGHLVNEEYIKSYNEMFLRYYEEITCKKTIIDTSRLDVYSMNDKIANIILSNLLVY